MPNFPFIPIKSDKVVRSSFFKHVPQFQNHFFANSISYMAKIMKAMQIPPLSMISVCVNVFASTAVL